MSLALGLVLGLDGNKDPEIESLLFPVGVIAIFSQVLTQKGKNRDAQSRLTEYLQFINGPGINTAEFSATVCTSSCLSG